MKHIYKLPSVTVILLNLDGIEFTRKCLRSLLRTQYPNFKIFVLDNGSRFDEAEIIRKEFSGKSITVSRVKKNLGFAGGNNYAANKVRSKYIVFLNNDTVVKENWLGPLVKEAEKNSNIAACQPKILSAIKRGVLDYAGASGGFLDKYGHPFARGRIIFFQEKDKGQYDNTAEIVWVSGTAFFVRRDMFLKFHGFDPDFFIYHEEIDLCWRMKEKGLRLVCVPASVVYHYGKGYTGKNPVLRIFRIHKNMWLMSLKHLSISRLLFRIPLDIGASFLYLIKGDFPAAMSVYAVYFWMLSNLDIVIAKRQIYKYGLRDDFLYPRSIVIDYYLFCKRKFTDLNWQTF